MADDRKLSIGGRTTLNVNKGSGPGQVRQNFSHGRTKTVVVERKRRKLLKKDSPAVTPEVVTEDVPVVEVAKPPVEQAALTTTEQDARAEALKDAIRAAEEDRMRAAEQKRQRQVREETELEEQRTRSAAEKRIEADEAAKRKAEEDAKTKAAAEAQKRKDEEERLHAEEEAARADKERTAPSRLAVGKVAEKEAEKRNKAAPKKTRSRPSRHGGERRRSGKLTVTKALEGGDTYRPRSLAAYRRAQAKQRRLQDGSAGASQKRVREIVIPDAITVQELSNRMAEKANVVIKTLMDMDVMATIDSPLDPETAELVAAELGHTIKRVSEADVEIGIGGIEDDASTLLPRSPVVTVMGHVDHGKTSLLDAIRDADVVAGEAGGITQHIGAYQVNTSDGQKITFIDTPGHAAFTQMRARGASVTDIVVLVVAADDGIMPQTVEAINHAKAAAVPIIVAINKMDKTGADADKVRQGLLQHEIVVEALSGDVLDVEVSAITKVGLDKLLEAINLQAEVMEIQANPDREADGVVIESNLDKGRGATATALVQGGTLGIGDIIVAGSAWGKVRALIDDRGEQITSAGPGQPVIILGLNETPEAGDEFAVVESEARARQVVDYRQSQKRKVADAGPVSLESMFSAIQGNKAKEVPIVIKGDVHGSVEAISSALDDLGTEDVIARVLHAGVGGITESDITLAQASNALVIGFNVRANKQARDAAAEAGIVIEYFSIIYNLVDTVKAAMEGRLDPAIEEEILGLAEVKDVFSAGKGKAAGCIVVDGAARANAKARLLRDDVVVYTGRLTSLRRFKDDVKEVKAGIECGMSLENFIDIKAGDKIEMFETHERKRTL